MCVRITLYDNTYRESVTLKPSLCCTVPQEYTRVVRSNILDCLSMKFFSNINYLFLICRNTMDLYPSSYSLL